MRRLSAFICALLMVGKAVAQPVPDGIHRDGNGHPDVCGLTARDVPALEEHIKARTDVERLDQTPEYTAYAIGGYRQLTFTTARNRAHPAVTCRQVVDQPGGGSTIQTSISCYASREDCDWLYREFEALTERTIRTMNGGR